MKSLILAAALFVSVANATPQMELSVVVDSETAAYYGSKEELQKAVDSTSKYAARIWSEQIGVELIVKDVEVTDKLTTGTNPDFLLRAVQDYRLNDRRSGDVTVLLTRRSLSVGSKTYAGYANIGNVCDAGNAAIVTLQDTGLEGQTLAHEIAHTAGSPHDGEKPCEKELNGPHLMASSSHGGDFFSACTAEVVKKSVETHGDCLVAPKPMTPAPVAEPAKSGGGGGSMDWKLLAVFVLLGYLRWRLRK